MSKSHNQFDFEAWVYRADAKYPSREQLPVLGNTNLVADDMKFAFNCWALLRLSFFFGCSNPRVLSALSATTPSMNVSARGNRVFHMHADLKAKLSPPSPGKDSATVKIALMASPGAYPINAFPWASICSRSAPSTTTPMPAASSPPAWKNVELVCGMENGMREETLKQCDHCVYIPQYGSIGSLSVMSALGVGVHHLHTAKVWSDLGQPSGLEDDIKQHCDQTSAEARTEVDESLVAKVKTLERQRPCDPEDPKKPMPHSDELIEFSNPQISAYLKSKRDKDVLRLGMLWHNDVGDRNIGASIRNANVYNCEKLILLNRKKFNIRGAVGTQHYLHVPHFPTFHEGSKFHAEFQRETEGYELWEIHQYLPYLQHHLDDVNSTAVTYPYIYHDHTITPFIKPWESVNLSLPEPVVTRPPVFADDPLSMQSAVDDVISRGLKGILLVVPDEGSTLRESVRSLCSRTAFVIHPNRDLDTYRPKKANLLERAKTVSPGDVAHSTQWMEQGLAPTTTSPYQLGMSAQVTTAIMMERVRWAMECRRANSKS